MRSIPGVKGVILCAICERGTIIRGRLGTLELNLNLLFYRRNSTASCIMRSIPFGKFFVGNLSELIALSSIIQMDEFLSQFVALPFRK